MLIPKTSLYGKNPNWIIHVNYVGQYDFLQALLLSELLWWSWKWSFHITDGGLSTSRSPLDRNFLAILLSVWRVQLSSLTSHHNSVFLLFLTIFGQKREREKVFNHALAIRYCGKRVCLSNAMEHGGSLSFNFLSSTFISQNRQNCHHFDNVPPLHLRRNIMSHEAPQTSTMAFPNLTTVEAW